MQNHNKNSPTLVDSIDSMDSLANIRTNLRRIHIHINPPIYRLQSIYPIIPQAHSISSYTNSLFRP